MSEKIENSTADLLNSMRNHVRTLAEEGAIDPERIKYSIADRRSIVASRPDDSDRKLGLDLCVDHKTIAADRRALRGENSPPANADQGRVEDDSGENSPPNPELERALLTMCILVRCAILMDEERKAGAYDNDHDRWVCDLWMCGRHITNNDRTIVRLLPGDDKVAISALKAELAFSELEKEIIKNWKPKRLSDDIALAPILHKVGGMADVEFWNPLKAYFPKWAAINLGERAP